jgi:hypothetical protein
MAMLWMVPGVANHIFQGTEKLYFFFSVVLLSVEFRLKR